MELQPPLPGPTCNPPLRVAWTVVGCLGFVLAVMASGRVIAWAMALRKASLVEGAPRSAG